MRLERIVSYFRKSIRVSLELQESLQKLSESAEESTSYARGLEGKIKLVEEENQTISRELSTLIQEAVDKQKAMGDAEIQSVIEGFQIERNISDEGTSAMFK